MKGFHLFFGNFFKQVSRSIGDFYLKDPKFEVPKGFTSFWGRIKGPVIKTELSTFRRRLTNIDKFVIFASRGLWELVSNDEAVRMVQDRSDAEVLVG